MKAVKILLIDNDINDIKVLQRSIYAFFPSATIYEASTGEEGIKRAGIYDPDIIILSTYMPGIDGFETCKKLKKHKDIPVLFISAKVKATITRIRVLEAGGDSFLVKPIDEFELAAQIKALLKKRESKKELASLVDQKAIQLLQANARTKELLEQLKFENQVRMKNERALLEAQRISCIGSFEIDEKKDTMECTSEIYSLLGIEDDFFISAFEDFYPFIHEEDIVNLKEAYFSLIIKKEKADCICRLAKREKRIVSITIRENKDEFGNVIGQIGTMQDITRQISREKELETARKEAEKANQVQSMFLANMSHEIRTPMNGMLGMIDLALMTDEKEEQVDYLMTAKESARSLLRIIEDILDYSKLEAESMKIIENEFSFPAFMQNMIKLHEKSSQDKGIVLKLSIDEKIPERVITDEIRLRQVLSNLLNNAVKFTDEGTICLLVKEISKKDKNLRLLFSVKDTGIGISKESIHRLFRRFTQVNNTFEKQYQGTGLGLAISKNLVKLLGGDLKCKSEVGRGSEFFFEMNAKLP